jgi:hypothetical protein
MSVAQCHLQAPTAAARPTLRRRILRMMGVWAILGALMGAGAGLAGGGIAGAIGGTIAGTVELTLLGACFALIGGRPGESIFGAVAGLLTGLTVSIAAQPASPILVTCFGLVFGGIAGATLRPYLKLLALPVILFGRFLRQRRWPMLSPTRLTGTGTEAKVLVAPVSSAVGVARDSIPLPHDHLERRTLGKPRGRLLDWRRGRVSDRRRLHA